VNALPACAAVAPTDMQLVTQRAAKASHAAAAAPPSSSACARAAPRGWIAIIEPNFSGHRWRYVEWIAHACIDAGERCVIVTDRAHAAHPLAQRVAAGADPALRIATVDLLHRAAARLPAFSAYARFHALFARAFADVSRELPVRLVVVPYADYFFYTLGVLGSPFGATGWVGLVMGVTFHHARVGVRTPRRPLVDSAKSALFARGMRSRGLRRVLTIDPTLPGWFAQSRAAPHAAPLDYVADPFPATSADDPAHARARLGLDPRARHLLVYGAISERKGIRELVHALAAYGHDAPTLLIAGVQDPETRAFLNAHLPRVAPAPVVFDRFIAEDDERALFCACDAVWLGYRQHYGMSGVLVQAYRFGKPVIATADGLIGWFCRDGRLGPRLDDLTPASIARACDELAQHWWNADAATRRRVAPHADDLLARNTLDQFQRAFRDAVLTSST